MFNTDSLYKAYEKRINKLPKLIEDSTVQGLDRKELMAKEIEERIEKRNQFSRKRVQDDSKDVTSINERNRMFN